MYVIVGASGNTGSIVAEKLLAAKAQVRVVGRNAKHLERFAAQGAEPFVCDITDAKAVEKAFAGAAAAYVMIPPNIGAPDVRAYQERTSDNLAAAIRKNSVGHAVALSSVGADKADGTGLVVGLHNLEQKLSEIPNLRLLILRPGYFMENLLPQISVIQSQGTMMGPIRADLPLPMIATSDIGGAAADGLAHPNFEGRRMRELLGPRDVTYPEAAKLIGEAVGKPELRYQQAPAAALKSALLQMSMSPSMIDGLMEMSDALNSGVMKPVEPRSSKSKTPTTLERFLAEVFVPAYRGKAASAKSGVR